MYPLWPQSGAGGFGELSGQKSQFHILCLPEEIYFLSVLYVELLGKT